jgi:hypothetical protein
MPVCTSLVFVKSGAAAVTSCWGRSGGILSAGKGFRAAKKSCGETLTAQKLKNVPAVQPPPPPVRVAASLQCSHGEQEASRKRQRLIRV